MDGVPSGVPREGQEGKYSSACEHVKRKIMMNPTLALLLSITASPVPAYQAAPTSPEELRARVRDREILRDGLLHAYLAPYRYLGAEGASNQIADMYRRTFGLGEKGQDVVQGAFNVLASPDRKSVV